MRSTDKRKQQILALLRKNKTASVQELAAHFRVSALTIRRDLDDLEGSSVRRFHGGAEWLDSNQSPSQRLREQFIDKIAKAAAARVYEGDIVFINSSSTALKALHYIKQKSITAITNNGKALSTPLDLHIHLILCGGDISFPKEALTGEFALNNLKNVRATRSIMGISGISKQMGLSTSNLAEAPINNTMLKRTSTERIIVADSTKLNHSSAFSSGDLSLIDTLITDSDAPDDLLSHLRKLGVHIVLIN